MPPRSRHAQDALKRGSDSLLEAKLKEQINKPRSLNNRAQSLDLTHSLSRITETSSSYLPPESPSTSTGEGANSSPMSVNAPLFPSVYGPPLSARSSGVFSASSAASAAAAAAAAASQAQAQAMDREDDDVAAEVSRVMSNLGL